MNTTKFKKLGLPIFSFLPVNQPGDQKINFNIENIQDFENLDINSNSLGVLNNSDSLISIGDQEAYISDPRSEANLILGSFRIIKCVPNVENALNNYIKIEPFKDLENEKIVALAIWSRNTEYYEVEITINSIITYYETSSGSTKKISSDEALQNTTFIYSSICTDKDILKIEIN